MTAELSRHLPPRSATPRARRAMAAGRCSSRSGKLVSLLGGRRYHRWTSPATAVLLSLTPRVRCYAVLGSRSLQDQTPGLSDHFCCFASAESAILMPSVANGGVTTESLGFIARFRLSSPLLGHWEIACRTGANTIVLDMARSQIELDVYRPLL